MFNDEELETLKIDSEAIRIRLISEPYVVYSAYGYQAAIDVWHNKKQRRMRLFLSARTLSAQLEEIRNTNDMAEFSGIEFWIHKESDDRRSKYVLSE